METKLKLKILFVILCVSAIAITIYINYRNQVENEFYKKISLTFKEPLKSYEIGTELSAISFILDTNATDIDLPIIDSSKVGEHSFVYIAYDAEGRQKEYVLVLNFVDPIYPVIMLTQSEVTITEGDSINLKDYVKEAYDEVDGELKVTIKKAKDYKKVGTHEITYQVKDKNGNVSKAILKLIVNEKKVEEVVSENENNNAQNGLNQTIQPNNKQTQNNHSSSLQPKQFLFSDGYTMPQGSNSAFDACLLYKGSANGGCYPMSDHTGIYIGVEFQP